MVLPIALIMVMASTAASPTNSNSRHGLPSLFMLNYDKHSNDEHLNWFNVRNQWWWSNQNKPSTTQATTSTTTTTTTTIPTTAISSPPTTETMAIQSTTLAIPPSTTSKTTTIETTTAETTTIQSTTLAIPPSTTSETTTIETTTAETTTLEMSTTTLPPTTTVIFSGETVVEGEFPFMVWIDWEHAVFRKSFEWDCSGTLISTDYVLTAANCVVHEHEYEKDYFYAKFGYIEVPLHWTWGNEASKIIGHPKYKSSPRYNNIALMKLSKSIKLSSTTYPACLWKGGDGGDGHTSVDEPVIALGYSSDRKLIKSNYDIYPNSRCKGSEKFGDRLGCAGMAGGQRERCSEGRLGGPLVVQNSNYSTTTSSSECRYWVVGIITNGPMQCGGRDEPDTFTRIEPFVDWIEGIIHK